MRSTTASRSLVACSTWPSRRTRLSRAVASSVSAWLQRLVGLAQPGLADGQPVGRLLAIVLGLGDLVAQRHALGLDLGRLGGELVDRRGDLSARAASSSTIWPSASASRLLQPAWSWAIWPRRSQPHRRLARQAIAVALGLDQAGAQLGDARRARRRPATRSAWVSEIDDSRASRKVRRISTSAMSPAISATACSMPPSRVRSWSVRRATSVCRSRASVAARSATAMALLGGALGGARRLARVLGLAPRGFGHRAFMRAGLLDAGLLGIAGGGEPARLGLDARLVARHARPRRPRSAGGSRPAGCAG